MNQGNPTNEEESNENETAAVEADKEDLEDQFINTEASAFMNSEVGKKIAAKRAKREAAKRKRGERVNRSISEINAMTDGMKELLKVSTFKKPAKKVKPKNVNNLGETFEEEGERVMDESRSQEMEDAFYRNEQLAKDL